MSGVCLCLRAEVRSRINKQIQRTLISVNLSQPLGNKKKKNEKLLQNGCPTPEVGCDSVAVEAMEVL